MTGLHCDAMRFPALSITLLASVTFAVADTQIKPGVGNSAAETTGHASPLVDSAFTTLQTRVGQIQNKLLRTQTLDALTPETCVVHRANLTSAMEDEIVASLLSNGLVNSADAANIDGGVKAGVFPALLKDGTSCPSLPLDFYGAPGSTTGSHHSYPGGLSVHEAFNQQSSINFASAYRGEYGHPNDAGLPIDRSGSAVSAPDVSISQDVILAAPAWHDWAKRMVMQWTADGTEFVELNFGGAGATDNNGAAGDSRTGGHHIIGIAETMARGLSPLLVITQASAHSAPTLGNEYKVVNWLHAGAIIARIDPIAKGYLTVDSQGHYRLPQLGDLGNVDLVSMGQTNLLIEYQIHNLSDADFVNSIPAISISQTVLKVLAPLFGYDPTSATQYNTNFRNPVLSYLSGERLEMIYGKSGIAGVYEELSKLRALSII